jgi:hypothetical protein
MRVMRVRPGPQELLGVFPKLCQAVMAAKEISFAVVDVFPCSRAWLDIHAADWINHVLKLTVKFQ